MCQNTSGRFTCVLRPDHEQLCDFGALHDLGWQMPASAMSGEDARKNVDLLAVQLKYVRRQIVEADRRLRENREWFAEQAADAAAAWLLISQAADKGRKTLKVDDLLRARWA